MLTAKDIREVGFTKAIGGYKQDEVDDLLDTVEADYSAFEETIASLNAKIEQLNNEIDTYKNSQSSLQNILIEAQKLADKTVNDAKEKAALIINDAKSAAENAAGEAKVLLETFDVRFNEKKANAEKELEEKLASAKAKLQAVEAATNDSVKRQQALFDKTRIDIAGFKAEILEMYKKQIEFINKMPDCVAMDATRAAEAVSLVVDAAPQAESFVAPLVNEVEEPNEEIPPVSNKGFVFNDDLLTDTDIKASTNNDEDDGDDTPFSNGFFR